MIKELSKINVTTHKSLLALSIQIVPRNKGLHVFCLEFHYGNSCSVNNNDDLAFVDLVTALCSIFF